MYTQKVHAQILQGLGITRRRRRAKATVSHNCSWTNPTKRKARESLERWRNRVGLAKLEKITRDAAIRGTAMHKYLEDLIRGERSLDLTPLGVEATKMAEIIVERGLNDCSEIYGIEATLFYPGLYAGSVDLIDKYHG